MADLSVIRSALGANLRTALPADQGQVSAYLLDSPTSPCLAVAGVDADGAEPLSFRRGAQAWFMVIEAFLGRASDIGGQKWLDKFLATTGGNSVQAAVLSDRQLTSRLLENGTVQPGQAPAADDVGYVRYRGQSRFTVPAGYEVLLASWTFQVITTG